MIQYHMQQILECQKVVDEYRSMVEGGRDLIPFKSNLIKSVPVVISHIIYMIDLGRVWHQKTFGAILAELWRNWDKQVYEQENDTIYYKEKAQIHVEMDKKEVVDLCGESQTMTRDHWKAEQNKERDREANKNRPEKEFHAQEMVGDEVAMLCWENSEEVLEKA